MKQTNLGFVAALTLGGLMICGPIARAQDATPATPPPAPGTNAPGALPPHHRDRVSELTKQLDLTPDQQDKLKAIFKDQREQLMTLRKDDSLSDDDKRAKHKEIMTATNDKIKAMLTPDQQTKWAALQAKHAPKPNN